MKKVEPKKWSNLNQIKSRLFYGLGNVVIEGDEFSDSWEREPNQLASK